MRKEVERMKKYGLIGLMLLVMAMIPTSAVEFTNVTVTFEMDGNPVTCPSNDSIVNMTIRFELDTTFPDTYTIWIVPQPIVQSNFNFTDAKLGYVKRNATDQTNNATVIFREVGRFVVYVNEGGTKTLSGNNVFELKIVNVTTPPSPGNYTIALGLKDYSGYIQYGEYAIVKRICPVPVVPEVPEPAVKPCGCAYKLEDNTLMQAVPEACFKLVAPYKEGMKFLGFKKFIDDPLIPVEVITNFYTEYSGECLIMEDREKLAVDQDFNFSIGSFGWNGEGDWQWGQPIDLIDICPDLAGYRAWGLKLNANYTAGSVVYNLTSPLLGDCNFNGTVNVYIEYYSQLEDGDYVVIEAWNGTHWVELGNITADDNTDCRGGSLSTSYQMNATGEWKTQIRFRFVGDGDTATDKGFYVYYVEIKSQDTCTYKKCAEYKPEYYYTKCQCLKTYVDIELNAEYSVWTEAIYYVNDTGIYQNKTSKAFNIVFDNAPPTFRDPQDTGTSLVFSITDNLAGVEANADSEPINVKYKDVGFQFSRWNTYPPYDRDIRYYYDLYDPLKQTRSVAVHFDRIELGYQDYLSIIGGCRDCDIFEYNPGDWGGNCWYGLYTDWGDYYWDGCPHSMWVRVPLQNCEMNCSASGYCEGGCYYLEECDDCAKIRFYDNLGSSQFGISIDMLVYGTGIAVLKNGVDITDQCTIASDGFNATVTVPKNILAAGDEVVVVATDKVGNANYLKYIVSGVPATPPPTTPPQEPWQAYDSNGNGTIEDQELIAAILDWLDNRLSDQELINVILKWLSG
ncbi:MAG: hypothetical protein QW532_05680 [Archaeoglobaceae archaeon]